PDLVPRVLAGDLPADFGIEVGWRSRRTFPRHGEAVAQLEHAHREGGTGRVPVLLSGDCRVDFCWGEPRGIEPLGLNFVLNVLFAHGSILSASLTSLPHA